MFSITTLPLQALLVLLFTLLAVIKRSNLWVVFAVAFVVVSLLLRISIEPSMVRDFAPYFESFQIVKYGFVPAELLIEPYRLILFKVILAFGDFDSSSQIVAIYLVHFLLVTLFFLWLAFQRTISFEVKLILFLAFYPPMAFVWIRAGMAYIASCFLILTFNQGRWKILHFLLPAIHLSTVPLLIATLTKDIRPARKMLVTSGIVLVGFFALNSPYGDYVTNKWVRYVETGDSKDSINFLIFHLFGIFIFLYFAFINPKFRKNYTVLFSMATYLGLYSINPVLGLRMFPFVLIACMIEGLYFQRYQRLTLLVVLGFVPMYFFRFQQILL